MQKRGHRVLMEIRSHPISDSNSVRHKYPLQHLMLTQALYIQKHYTHWLCTHKQCVTLFNSRDVSCLHTHTQSHPFHSAKAWVITKENYSSRVSIIREPTPLQTDDFTGKLHWFEIEKKQKTLEIIHVKSLM